MTTSMPAGGSKRSAFREGAHVRLRHWKIKAAIQGVLARVRVGEHINATLQRLLGGRRDIDGHIDSKIVDDGLVHLRHLSQLGFPIAGCTAVEVGTGWLPVLPMLFRVAGAERVHTYDVRPLLQLRSVGRIVRRIGQHLPAIAAATQQPLELVQHRWSALARTLGPETDTVLAQVGIDYHAPADAGRTALANHSVDLVYSNSVLEHVPSAALTPLFAEARRILRGNGLILHSVNCGDHYAYFDPAISAINYLSFDDLDWRRWNNALLFQNRLRPVDFLAAARDAGFDIVLDRHQARPELLALLPSLPLAPHFSRYSNEELCCTSLDFAARPREAA